MPLVVISGLDGCGKTTQINLLKNNLSRQNKEYGKDFKIGRASCRERV